MQFKIDCDRREIYLNVNGQDNGDPVFSNIDQKIVFGFDISEDRRDWDGIQFQVNIKLQDLDLD